MVFRQTFVINVFLGQRWSDIIHISLRLGGGGLMWVGLRDLPGGGGVHANMWHAVRDRGVPVGEQKQLIRPINKV